MSELTQNSLEDRAVLAGVQAVLGEYGKVMAENGTPVERGSMLKALGCCIGVLMRDYPFEEIPTVFQHTLDGVARVCGVMYDRPPPKKDMN